MNKKGQDGMIVAIVFAIILGLLSIYAFGAFDVVSAGHVGVTDRFGVIGERTLEPGLHYTGFFTKTNDLSVRVQRRDYKADSASRDLQMVNTEVTVNYRLSPEYAVQVYRNIGLRYADVIIFPIVQESVKGATARYTAEELITKRPEVRQVIVDDIQTKLSDQGLIVTEVAITNFEFSKTFNDAIEAKQVAEQEASRALNQKRQTITEAEAQAERQKLEADARAYQVIAEADAEAYALRIIREELSKSPELVQYRAVEAWDGVLPYFYGADGNMLFNLPVN